MRVDKGSTKTGTASGGSQVWHVKTECVCMDSCRGPVAQAASVRRSPEHTHGHVCVDVCACM